MKYQRPNRVWFSFGVMARLLEGQSVVYHLGMTNAVAHIIERFEQLSEAERRELRQVIAERVPMSEDLTDEDFAALAAASFRALDEEENHWHA